VCCDNDGRPSFDRIRYRRHDAGVFLYAFDLIELNGKDLRRDPLAVRKATLRSKWGRVCDGTSTSRTTARLSSAMPASSA
jgi:ATP-dependent DNA ligase